MWTILSVFFAGTVLIARGNREPGPLQALGFGLCDGEPCWRGIKPGIDWSEVRKRFPAITYDGEYFVLPLNTAEIQEVVFQPSPDATKLDEITLRLFRAPPTLLGELVALYGRPCRISFPDLYKTRLMIDFVYPKLLVRYDDPVTANRLNGRLESHIPLHDFPVSEIRIVDDAPMFCRRMFEDRGPWQGFASFSTYIARNRRALGAK
jgi:hypothetical protein